MNIYYHLSEYISHRRAGQEYMACLSLAGHTLVPDPADAACVILHDEPTQYAAIIAAHPAMEDKPRIGYCVWEANILPEAYRQGLTYVDHVWTASAFSASAIRPHVADVAVVPHVVHRGNVTVADMAWMRKRLGVSEDTFLFYTIVDGINPRKNLPALLSAYAMAFPATVSKTAHVRLVIKQYRQPVPVEQLPGVISIPELLDDGKMSALHALADCYVSAHHAEAWGLALSEAMAWGNPVIATGYSGNMDFMNTGNSVPVPYSLAPVSERMCTLSPLYTRDMVWADIHVQDLALAMQRRARNTPNRDEQVKIQESMRSFNRESVATIMANVLLTYE